MKLTSQTTTLRTSRAVRFKAVISKSKKLGVEKRHQKTWSFPTVAPEFTLKEMLPSVEADAKRWEAKILARYLLPQKEAVKPTQPNLT